MLDFTLNIIGIEWIVIIFIALVLLLGTNRLPEAARKLGKAVNEYNKTKNDVQNQMKDFSTQNLEVNGPVQNERQKLEVIAKSMGIDFTNKTDDELRRIITSKMGKVTNEEKLEKSEQD